MTLLLVFFLQIIPIPELPNPDSPVIVGGEILGPYILREDSGQTTKVILKNGLTVLVRENNAVPLTSITAHVRVGYVDEPDEMSGISHVTEHMVVNGSDQRGVGQIAPATKALGGSLNAYTDYDRTVYRTVVPAENAVQALEIQAHALWNPRFDARELSREVELILQEDRLKLDDPPALAVERLYATAFREHRMRRWRIGSDETLRALVPDDLVAFHETYYQPSNVIVVVVGQFDREEVLTEIVRIFEDVADKPVEREQGPVEPVQTAFRYNWERGPLEHAQVVFGFHVPDRISEDAPVLEVLSAILTTGRASRMNRFLRDEFRLIHGSESRFVGFGGLGFLQLRFETSVPLEAEVAVLEEIERIQRFGVGGEELARARLLLAEEYYRTIETIASLGEEMARQEALGDWSRIERYFDEILRVSVDDIGRVARQYLITSNLSVFEYLPNSVTRTYTNEDFLSNVLEQVPVDIVERSVVELPVSGSVSTQDAGLVVDLVRPPERRQILRGPDVYVVEDHRLPLVSFGIFYPGGRLYESARNFGITELMLHSALRGTQRYNSDDISRRLENAGARVEVVNEPDFFGYVIDGLSGQLHLALEILMQVLQEPTFPEDDVEGELRLQEARIRQLREDTFRYPEQLFMETLFEGHPYAQSQFGAESSLNTLTPEDLRNWHRLHQRAVMPVIVIVGDTNGTALVAPIAETLTNEDLSLPNISRLPAPTPTLEREERFLTADRQQSALIYGALGSRFADSDRLPLTVIQNVLSGFGGRLFESIHEEHGLADTVRVVDTFLGRSGALLAYTAFSPENEDRVLAAVEAEMERLIQDGISEQELESAVNYAIGLHAMSLESRRSRTLAFARAAIFGDGMASVTDFGEAIRGVSRELVQATAGRFLSPTFAKIVVLRGKR